MSRIRLCISLLRGPAQTLVVAHFVHSFDFKADPFMPNATMIEYCFTTSTEAEAPAVLNTSNSVLPESHELVELAADKLLPHLVFLPRQDLEFASD